MTSAVITLQQVQADMRAERKAVRAMIAKIQPAKPRRKRHWITLDDPCQTGLPAAIQNACRYHQVPAPSQDELIDLARCRYGAPLFVTRALKRTPLIWRTAGPQAILESAGIIGLVQAHNTVRAVFVFREGPHRYLVNSGLTDAPVIELAPADLVLPRLRPGAKVERGWLLLGVRTPAPTPETSA